MDTEKYIDKIMPQNTAKQFADILSDAVGSYIENMDNCNSGEWLKQYLTDKISDKTPEEITDITSKIINTVKLHEETIHSMQEFVKSGRSVEAWFQDEITFPEQSVGQQAHELTEIHSALTEAANQYSSADEQQEVIDVEVIPADEWNDDNWNKYKIKELVSETVKQAGETALKTTASDLYQKVTEYGFQTVLMDKELVRESVLLGADTGLKYAVSGAMEIAESQGIFADADSDTENRTLLASVAVENMKVFSSIAKGDMSLVDGLKHIGDTSVATIATIVKNKVSDLGAKVGSKIGAAVGTVFGPVGTAVGSFAGGVIGKMAGTTVGTKISEAVKKVGTAAKSVFSKVSSTVRSVGNKIASGLRSIFRGW